MSLGTNEPPQPVDVESTVRLLAAAKLGISADKLLVAFHAAAIRGSQGMSQALTGGATQAYGTKTYDLSTAAAGGAVATLEFGQPTATSRPTTIPTAAGASWWIGWYGAIKTAIGAAALCGVGAASGSAGSNELMIGGRGASSTANFVAFGAAGAVIDSGLALDTALRQHQMWRDGVNTYYQIDGLAPIAGTARPSADAGCYAAVFDSAAVARTLGLVWMACSTLRP